jgi:hypothetical protein
MKPNCRSCMQVPSPVHVMLRRIFFAMVVGTSPHTSQNYTWLLFIDRNGENKRDSSSEGTRESKFYSTTGLNLKFRTRLSFKLDH